MRISKSVWSPILGLADFIVSLFLVLACFSRPFFLSFSLLFPFGNPPNGAAFSGNLSEH